MFVHAKLLQSCLPVQPYTDCSPPGSSVHGILQAGILEWVAMLSSRAPSRPRDRTLVSYVCLHWQEAFLLLAPPGKPADSISHLTGNTFIFNFGIIFQCFFFFFFKPFLLMV